MTLSAGLLLYRRDPVLEVLLGHMGGPIWARKDEAAWSIPKGEVEGSDDPLTTARREFEEELGHAPPAEPLLELGTFRQSRAKTITIWAVEGDLDPTACSSNTFDLEWPPRSGRIQAFPEIDRAAWFEPTEATKKVIAGQRQVIARLLEVLAG